MFSYMFFFDRKTELTTILSWTLEKNFPASYFSKPSKEKKNMNIDLFVLF